MARKKIEVNQWTQIANEYIEKKAIENDITKETKELRDKIVEHLETIEDEEERFLEGDTSRVVLSYSHKDVYDEEEVIDILKKAGFKEIVKIKEYIDFDALEAALYNEKLPKDVLKKIAEHKHDVATARLNIRKSKKK